MRIAIVTPGMDIGGIEVFVLRLGECLARSGESVTIISSEWSGRLVEECKDRGIGYVFAGGAWTSNVGAALKVENAIRIHGCEVAVMNSSRQGQMILPRLRGLRTFSVIHTDTDKDYRLGLWNADRGHRIICPSRRIETGVRARDCHVPTIRIEHGVPVPRAARPDALGEFLHVLFVGRFYNPQKGVLLIPSILREAAVRGAKLEVSLVGDGPDLEAVQGGVQTCHPNVKLRMCGALRPAEVEREYQRSEVVLVPSYSESASLVLLEAMASGCAPVASRIEGVTDDVVNHGETGFLFPVGNVEEAGMRLEELWRDRQKAQEMGGRARAWIESNRTVGKMGEAYRTLFLDESRGRPTDETRSTAKKSGQRFYFGWKDYLPEAVRRTMRTVKTAVTGGGRAGC